MRRFIFLLISLLACASPAHADMLMLGTGATEKVASYSGPGDVVSSAFGFWGFRCYNAAYSGNVAAIWDAATGNTTETLITCSAGGTLNYTINAIATTCAAACVVATLYDQSGGGHDLTQVTNSERPTYNNTGLGGAHGCMTYNAASTQFLTNAAITAQAQPLTFTMIVNRTGATTSYANIMVDVTNDNGAFFNNSTNTMVMRAPTLTSGAQFAATDNAVHAVQMIFNGASSNAYVDGSSTATNPGTNSIGAGGVTMGGNQQYLTGAICEFGWWNSAFNGTQQSNMNTNIHNYGGF